MQKPSVLRRHAWPSKIHRIVLGSESIKISETTRSDIRIQPNLSILNTYVNILINACSLATITGLICLQPY